MAKLSQTTREIINVVIFLVVVGLILTVFVIYPLNKTAQMQGRLDIDTYDPDSLAINDPALFIEYGFAVDTFTVEADGLTELATFYLTGSDSGLAGNRGTVILIPEENSGRESIKEMAKLLVDSGLAVVTYDQRASGLSTGKYHGDGQMESEDLLAIIHFFTLREKLAHPVTVVGFSLGGDAALLAAEGTEEIDKVIAIEPYLTSSRMYDILKERYGIYWIPFFHTVMSFWYEIRSSFAPEPREIEDLMAVAKRTVLVLSPDLVNSDEVAKLRELSDDQMLSVISGSDNSADLSKLIWEHLEK